MGFNRLAWSENAATILDISHVAATPAGGACADTAWALANRGRERNTEKVRIRLTPVCHILCVGPRAQIIDTISVLITETKIRRVEPDVVVLEIIGRLSLGNTVLSIENSTKRLIDEGARRMVIDLAQLNSADSSGIGMLVSCFAHMEQKGGHLRIAGPQGSVLKVFETVHLDRIVPMKPDVDSACADLP